MKSAIFFVLFVAVARSLAYEVIEDDQGDQFFLIPLQRQRRYDLIVVKIAGGGGITNFSLALPRYDQENYPDCQFEQTNVGVSGGGGAGTQVTVGHQGVIHDDGTNRFTGGGFASKTFHPSGPTTVGGNLGYTHVPSNSNLNLGAQNTRGFGTDLSATGNANLWRSNNGNSRLDAVGTYSRHYGGQFGTGRPNYYGGLQFTHRF